MDNQITAAPQALSFEDYVTKRFEKQVAWYDARSFAHRRQFYVCQIIVILCAYATPILSSSLGCNLRWITTCVAACVAILLSLLHLFKFQEKWIRKRKYCERLKRELVFFEYRNGEYSNLPDDQAKQIFIANVERIIEAEQSDWMSEHKQPMQLPQPHG